MSLAATALFLRRASRAAPVVRAAARAPRASLARAAVKRHMSSVAAIKELRARTGAPMMECKHALADPDVNGDLDAAVDWLRKKGMAVAGKKAGRAAAHGLVGVHVDGPVAAIVEVNSETDFVGRNDLFKGLVQRASKAVVGSVQAGTDPAVGADAARDAALPGGDSTGADCSVGDGVTDLAGKVRENLVLRRATTVSAGPGGVAAAYVHNSVGPDVGTIGAVVALAADPPVGEGDADAAAQLQELGKRLAMQVVAARPRFATRDQVPADALDKEREFLREQALASGKPAEIVDKMVEGRLNKFYGEHVLEEQECVVGEEGKVSKMVAAAGKAAGRKVSVVSFAHLVVGDGVETAAEDE